MAELERARQHAPGDLYVEALLGDRCIRPSVDHDPIIDMIRELLTTKVNWYADNADSVDYCRDIAEVVFVALWDRSYNDEATEVARVARRHGWSTANIEDRLDPYEHPWTR